MTYERERGLLSKADVIVSINEKEGRIFQEMLPEKQVVCARTALRPCFSGREPVSGRLLFVGSSYAPNLEGIDFFLTHVAPLLEKLAPGHFTLHVAGNCCSLIRSNGSGLTVNQLGRVENLDKEYEEAEIVLTPLLSGTGVSAKAVEAVAHGKALVATSVGARGLEDLFGTAILIGDTPEDFASRLLEISFSRDKRLQIEAHAKSAVMNELSPEKSYSKLVEALRS
jgi:glycosyltransferase involved in cell wall biosynthesis